MPLTRKFLEEKGVPAEVIGDIVKEHQSVLNEIKDERDQYKQDAEKLAEVTSELDKLKSDNTAAERIQALEKQVQSYEAKETNAKKAAALTALLDEVGNIDKRGYKRILAATDLSEIELDENGKIKNADGYKESLPKTWSDLVVNETSSTAKIDTPPNPDQGGESSPKNLRDALKQKFEE